LDELIVYIPWIFWPSPLWGNKELLFENDPEPGPFLLPSNIVVPTQNGLEKNAA
jgi:hypothetical protein